ncbi:hexokinase [Bacteroides sp. 224]|uniref:hexokinase family protein n=1 Tax=Bacteroides sp. 224 TaxID=2302936 RepID=UPI0013D736EE|nr:hexokinase [Bacteroides sp. 224]NDV65537.1 hexokinase [Bacteroides sp. 224]
MENIFSLATEELKFIADALQARIEEGLKEDNQEISAIPTHIHPKEEGVTGEERVLALDWGGTNFRAALVEYKDGKATIIEDVKHRLSRVETKGFTQEKLHERMGCFISELKQLDERVTKIGYCFSYPAASRLNGDAILLRWTKGIDIPDMINKPVGESLLKYLNNHKEINTTFKDIKVVNDTVASLFAGLTERIDGKPFDSYVGLIVGTGTNMASLMPLNKIEKLNSKDEGVIPVNLESGNFNPPHLTIIDNLVDAISNNKGSQRFEKAISGGYLGEIFKTVFMFEKVKYDFDGGDLSYIINNPDKNKKDHVDIANWVYNRSAQLVAASLAGLVQVLVAQDSAIKNIYLAADGTLFWSNDYEQQVEAELKKLLPAGVTMVISAKEKMQEPNLIGSAIAALS